MTVIGEKIKLLGCYVAFAIENKKITYAFEGNNDQVSQLMEVMLTSQEKLLSSLQEVLSIKPEEKSISVENNRNPVFGSELGLIGWYSYKQTWQLDLYENNFYYFSYKEGINLFYHYFISYKTLVEQYLPAQEREEITSQPWWKEFLIELPKLEAIYRELVTKGEIEEVKS